MVSSNVSVNDRLKSHSVLLVVFVLVVLGVIVWKLTNTTNTSGASGEGFLDAGLAEIRTQVLMSAYKKQSPETCNTGLCPLVSANTKGSMVSGGVAPCFLGLKDTTPGNGNSLKPLPEQPPALPQQFPKCIRCEDVINRAVSITPANGAFGLGHFLAKKKDSNSVVIIPEVVANSAVRRATDGNFRLILGLSDPLRGVSIYHPESDRVIARDAEGRVALVPANDFTGSLAPAATFELVDGPINYSTVSFKCIPINGESKTNHKYLGFLNGATPGGSPLMVISALSSGSGLPTGTTFEFDLVDIETGVPVIMNKHSGLACQAPVNSGVEGFWSSDGSNDSSREIRDKRAVRGLVMEGELGGLEIAQQETNGSWMNTNAQSVVIGYQQPIGGLQPVNISSVPFPLNSKPTPGGREFRENAMASDWTNNPVLTVSDLAPQKQVLVPSGFPGQGSWIMDRPFAANEPAKEQFADTVGMLPVTLEELGRVPDNLFQPASGLAFNNALNVSNQIYKDQLSDSVFQKLNAAKLSPNVQNILDYNAATYQIYQRENQDFSDKIANQDKSNSGRLDGLIGELDKQRVQGMSRDLFFMENQLAKANARPIPKK